MMGAQCRAVPTVQSGLPALPAANIKNRVFGVLTDCCLYPTSSVCMASRSQTSPRDGQIRATWLSSDGRRYPPRRCWSALNTAGELGGPGRVLGILRIEVQNAS